MFFPRLRRQAKWVFLALAIVFGAGFVFFGVGSGSTGIGDLFRGDFGGIFGGGGSSTSIGHLEKEVAKHPNSADAWRKLATAYERKSRNDDAIGALTRYTTLRPNDANADQELAGLYLTQAQGFYDQAQAIQRHLSRAALDLRPRAAPAETLRHHARRRCDRDEDGADRLAAAVAVRPRQARGADRQVAAAALPAADRHRLGHLGTDGPVSLQEVCRHAVMRGPPLEHRPQDDPLGVGLELGREPTRTGSGGAGRNREV